MISQTSSMNLNNNEQTVANSTATVTPATTNLKVKSTLITWNDFVSEYLSRNNVIELIANRKSDLVLIR